MKFYCFFKFRFCFSWKQNWFKFYFYFYLFSFKRKNKVYLKFQKNKIFSLPSYTIKGATLLREKTFTHMYLFSLASYVIMATHHGEKGYSYHIGGNDSPHMGYSTNSLTIHLGTSPLTIHKRKRARGTPKWQNTVSLFFLNFSWNFLDIYPWPNVHNNLKWQYLLRVTVVLNSDHRTPCTLV